MASTFTNQWGPQIWHRFVGEIWGQTMEQIQPKWPDFMDEKTKERKMFDDVGMVPPDIWTNADEGRDLPLDDYGQGYVTHYEQEKFGKRLIIPEEVEYFCQKGGSYERIYDGARMLAFTEKLTEDYYAVQFLNDFFTTANGRQGGDQKSLGAIDHPLRGGTLVENVFSATATAPPLAPSNTAVGVTLVKIERTPGENGRIDGTLKGTKLVGPSAYRFRMKEILKSAQKDDTANNAINALKGELSGDYVAVPLMTSQLNYFMKTNTMTGALTWWWGRKPRIRNVSNEINESTVFLGSAFWTGGWSDWRTAFGHQFE